MEVQYHAHARSRQVERSITDADVEEVLRNYETELPAKSGRRNRYKSISGRRIRVTFHVLSTDEYYVWTVTAEVSR